LAEDRHVEVQCTPAGHERSATSGLQQVSGLGLSPAPQ
jgi:hypothetical protein